MGPKLTKISGKSRSKYDYVGKVMDQSVVKWVEVDQSTVNGTKVVKNIGPK